MAERTTGGGKLRPAAIALVAGSFFVAATAFAADLSRDESRIIMQNFAACMASDFPRDAKTFVELDPVTVSAKDQQRLLRAECMPRPRTSAPMPVSVAMQGSMTHYRYAIAEALLLRQFRRTTPVIAPDSPPLAHPAIPAGSQVPVSWEGGIAAWPKHVAGSQNDARLSAFGECIVRASPEQSWALLKSEVASKAETATFAALTPTLARCLARDRAVQFGKFNARGTIALNFYRLAMAPRTQTEERG